MFIPINEQTSKLSQKLVWFEPPSLALADPIRFLAYAFRYARAAEMSLLREYLSDDELRQALRQAPPGIIDPRSWAYWHLVFDMDPQPLPQRQIG
jgi:hypothetical protein